MARASASKPCRKASPGHEGPREGTRGSPRVDDWHSVASATTASAVTLPTTPGRDDTSGGMHGRQQMARERGMYCPRICLYWPGVSNPATKNPSLSQVRPCLDLGAGAGARARSGGSGGQRGRRGWERGGASASAGETRGARACPAGRGRRAFVASESRGGEADAPGAVLGKLAVAQVQRGGFRGDIERRDPKDERDDQRRPEGRARSSCAPHG